MRELVTLLGFQVEDSALAGFDKKVDSSKEGLNDLTAAADEAAANVKKALGTITKAVIGLAVVGGGLAASIAAIVKTSASAGDEIAKSAPLLGLSVEEYQKYRYAADLAGVGNENFSASTQLLVRNIGDAIRGNAELQKSFADVGITLADLQTLSTGDILRKMSDGLSRIGDQSRRVSLSVDLLGRSGARMGMFLARGTEEMDRIMAEVEAFGMFNERSAASAEELEDSLSRVMYIFTGIRNELATKLFPIFTGILNEFREWVLVNRQIIRSRITRFAEVLTTVIQKLWAATKATVSAISSIVRRLGGLESVLKLTALAIVAPILAIIGPLFLAGKAVLFVTIPLLRFAAVAKIVAIVLIPLIPLFKLMLSTLTAIIGLKIAGWLVGLAGGFKALAAAIALPLIKLLAISAAIAALILVVEDFYYWMTGGDSVVGEFLGPFEALKNKFVDFFRPFLDQFEKVKAAFKALAQIIWDMFPPGVQQAIKDLLEFTKSKAGKVVSEFRADPASFLPMGRNDPVRMLAEKIAGAIDGIFSGMGSAPAGSSSPLYTGYTPSFAAAGGGGATTIDRSIHVNMSVPHGTTETQADYLKRTMRQVAEEVVQREVDDTHRNNPGRTK